MQDTICRLSMNLEEVRKELNDFKKYSYDFASPVSSSTIVAKMEMNQSLSQQSSMSKIPDTKFAKGNLSLNKLESPTAIKAPLDSPTFLGNTIPEEFEDNYQSNNNPLKNHNFTFQGGVK